MNPLFTFLKTATIPTYYGIAYKISPNMMGIQDGYNKNFHKKCIGYYEKFDTWWLFWDMKMVILESC